MKILVSINGVREGPFTFDEVEAKYRAGELKDNDLAWWKGLSEWKQVSDLLPHLLKSGGGLGKPEGDSVAKQEAEAVVSTSEDFPPGKEFGHYRIVGLLGRGGMGEVYEVTNEILGTRHALKLISEDVMERPGALDRFKKEGQVMAGMSHQGIVKVDDFGETENRHWLRMELVKGRSFDGRRIPALDEYLKARGGRLPEQEVKTLLRQILDALSHAHVKGLVHRDLKPANILLTDEYAKISDFGLVDTVGADWMDTQVRNTVLSPHEDTTIVDSGGSGSRARSIMGTYAFMSPEQRKGVAADARSDLYAVGLMTYRMLTGRETVAMKLPSEIVPGIDPGWNHWLERTMEEEPAKRFTSAKDMLAALEFPPAVVKTRLKPKPRVQVVSRRPLSSAPKVSPQRPASRSSVYAPPRRLVRQAHPERLFLASVGVLAVAAHLGLVIYQGHLADRSLFDHGPGRPNFPRLFFELFFASTILLAIAAPCYANVRSGQVPFWPIIGLVTVLGGFVCLVANLFFFNLILPTTNEAFWRHWWIQDDWAEVCWKISHYGFVLGSLCLVLSCFFLRSLWLAVLAVPFCLFFCLFSLSADWRPLDKLRLEILKVLSREVATWPLAEIALALAVLFCSSAIFQDEKTH